MFRQLSQRLALRQTLLLLGWESKSTNNPWGAPAEDTPSTTTTRTPPGSISFEGGGNTPAASSRGKAPLFGGSRTKETLAEAANTRSVTNPTGAASGPVHKTHADADFVGQIVALKRAYRGIAQRPSSLEDANAVFSKIPKDIKDWISEENAAYCLNGLGFFEIDVPQKEAVIQWTIENLAKFETPRFIIFASLGLNQLGVDKARYQDLINDFVIPTISKQLRELSPDEFHSFVKLLQRFNHENDQTWLNICAVIRERQDELCANTSTVVRLFTCLARYAPEHDVTRVLFKHILSQMTSIVSYDVTSFIKAVERWGMCTHNDLLVILRRHGLRINHNNARDLGTSFPAVVRLMHNMQSHLTSNQIVQLAEHMNRVFDDCESIVESYMTKANKELYWRRPEDIVSVFFAYESSGRRPKELFTLLEVYCTDLWEKLTPKTLGVVLGIFRRVRRGSAEFHEKAARQALTWMEKDNNAFTLEEQSHLALAFAARGADAGSDSVIPKLLTTIEADVKAKWDCPEPATSQGNVFGRHAGAKTVAAVNLSCAIEGLIATVGRPDLTALSARHLADLYVSCKTTRHGEIVEEILRRITGDAFTGQELNTLYELCHNEKQLGPAFQEAFTKALNEPVWGAWTLQTLGLASIEDKSPFRERALERAKSGAVSGLQFVTSCSILKKCYPKDEAVNEFVKLGMESILETDWISAISFIRNVILQDPDTAPDPAWLDKFFVDIVQSRTSFTGQEACDILALIQRVPKWKPTMSESKRKRIADLLKVATAPSTSAEEVLRMVTSAGSISASLVPRSIQDHLSKIAPNLPNGQKDEAEALVKTLKSPTAAAAAATPAASTPAAAKPSAAPKPAAPPVPAAKPASSAATTTAASPAAKVAPAAPKAAAAPSVAAKVAIKAPVPAAKPAVPAAKPAAAATPAPSKKPAPAPAAKKAAPAAKAPAPAKPAPKAAAKPAAKEPAKKPAAKAAAKPAAKKPAAKKGKK